MGFLRRKILTPILDQLRQGITPEKIALSIVLGVSIGLFPILGSTTFICLVIAFFLKLNQPVIQLFNYLVYPLQIILIPVFVRMGEFMFQAEPMSFSVLELKDQFLADPIHFLETFWMAGLHGIAAWTVMTPFLALLAYPFSLALIRRTAIRLKLGTQNV